MVEADLAAGELGAVEADRRRRTGVRSRPCRRRTRRRRSDPAAGEPGVAEVAAVKDDAREVEVQALPGHRRAVFEVRGDDPDDGVADFAAGPEGKPLRPGSLVARIGLVWHAQIGAQHIDAGLPVLGPVIRQARHGVHPGQPDRRRLIICPAARPPWRTARSASGCAAPRASCPAAYAARSVCPAARAALSRWSRLVARRPEICTATVAITVRTPTLAAMIAAVT